MVADEKILELVEKHRSDLKKAAKALVDAANRGGGEDNITVVFFEIAEGLEDTAQFDGEAGTRSIEDEDTLTEADGVPTIQATAAPRRRRWVSLPVAVAAALILVVIGGG